MGDRCLHGIGRNTERKINLANAGNYVIIVTGMGLYNRVKGYCGSGKIIKLHIIVSGLHMKS